MLFTRFDINWWFSQCEDIQNISFKTNWLNAFISKWNFWTYFKSSILKQAKYPLKDLLYEPKLKLVNGPWEFKNEICCFFEVTKKRHLTIQTRIITPLIYDYWKSFYKKNHKQLSLANRHKSNHFYKSYYLLIISIIEVLVVFL